MAVTLTLIGGPTALIDINGFRVVTDPTFDAPGEYPFPGGVLIKQSGPAIAVADLPAVDLVTLSHAHHPDNLDVSGTVFVKSAKKVVGSPMAKDQIDSIVALNPWQSTAVSGGNGVTYTVTSVPARHGPVGCEDITGIVTGFVIEGEGQPTIYISGDNAALELVEEVADRFPHVDVAVLFTGGARLGLFDNAPLTLTAAMAADAARILGNPIVFPVHSEGWAHFSEDRDLLIDAFDAAGSSAVLRLAAPGESVTI
jgi:L-ascorbate metabolism protein UlaG (beta-lactamase superfamily)